MKQIVALKKIAHKEITRILRIWMQTLLPPIISTTLYFLIFGRLLGPRIQDIEGFSYIKFIVPGLIMMSILTSSYMNVSSSFFGAKFQRHLEEILVSPTKTYAIIIGYILGGICRGLSIGILVTTISMLFTSISFYNIWIVMSIAILTSIVFALMGLMNGIFAKKIDDVTIIPTFVITPLTYLGGIFYSVSLLPEIWQRITLINPIFYIINTFRYGFLGISDFPIIYSYIMLLVFIFILYTICSVLIEKGAGMRN